MWWRIFSTDVSHHQYGGGISSVWWRLQYIPVLSSVSMCHIFSTVEGVQHGHATSQYGGGCALQTCHIINMEEGVQYRTTKTVQGVIGGCSIWEK